MKTIIIAGGIGAGKSVVSRIVASMGFPVYDTDSQARRIMDTSPEIIADIATNVCAEAVIDGKIERKILAECVFHNPDKLATLNAIVHGAVKDDIRRWQKASVEAGVKSPYFIETALLAEAGLDAFADEVWFVTAPTEIRIQRVMQRNNLSAAQVEARIAAQTDTIPARARVLLNDGHTPLLPQVIAALR